MRRLAPLLLSTLILASLASCSGGGDEAAAGGPPGGGMPPMAVEAVVVKAEPLASGLTTVGTLRADESVVVRPEIAGRIVALPFTEGQRVAAGATLFRLDDSVLRAELNEALVNLEAAKVANRRAEKLGSDKLISAQDRDQSRVALAVNEARVASARAALAKTTLSAPFAGLAGLREVSIGEVVNPGQALVNLVLLDPMEVEFSLPESALAAVAAGQPVTVAVDAFPNETFAGVVHAIEPQVDVASRTTRLRARVGNADYRLRPGLFARVTVTTGDAAATGLLVPEQALLQEGETRFVYTVVDGKAVRSVVTTGARVPGKVQVLSGLKPGDQVITAGQGKPMMFEGAAVSVLPPPGAEAASEAPAGAKN